MPGGAATPSGALARVEDALGKGVSSALERQRIEREFAAMDSQRELNEAMTRKVEAEQTKAKGTTAYIAGKGVEVVENLPGHIDTVTNSAKKIANRANNFLNIDIPYHYYRFRDDARRRRREYEQKR